MPIRFRCAYCNQLMGIARRKAGTIVNCPKCQGQVIVPQPEAAPSQSPSAFEQGDFDRFLDSPAVVDSAQVPAAHIQVLASPASQRSTWRALDEEPAQRGIFLTPGLVVLSCVLVLLLMAVAFFFGLLVGRG